MPDSFYRAFEDRYRGSRKKIKSRLCAYLPFIEPLASTRGAKAVDLGCGRGEWIELAGEIGFDACGFDLDDGMLNSCRELGLNAEIGDAVDSLRELSDGTVALITAFHLVEHIPFDIVRTLIDESLRVLQPGGVLILETPNPENLSVGASSFYLDPSHERPIPSELLSFAVEYAGFDWVKVARLQERPGLHGDGDIALFDVLAGVSPDYGVIAQKGGSAPLSAALQSAFEKAFGYSLYELAERFDSQAKRRTADVWNAAEQAGAKADQATDRATHVTSQLHGVLTSRSWRITAPLRQSGSAAKKLRAATREGRLKVVVGRRIKARVVQPAGRVIQNNPRLRSVGAAVLERTPRLRSRIGTTLWNVPPVTVADSMSPRAARIFAELEGAVNARKH